MAQAHARWGWHAATARAARSGLIHARASILVSKAPDGPETPSGPFFAAVDLSHAPPGALFSAVLALFPTSLAYTRVPRKAARLPVMNATERAQLADAVEGAAFTDMYAAAPAPLVESLGLRVQHFAGATLVMARNIPDPQLNRVIGLGLEQAARWADVEAIDEAYIEAGCPKYWAHVNPFARPKQLTDWLKQRGFAQPARRSWLKMWRDSKPVQPAATSLEVRLARPEEYAAAASCVCEAFGMPPAMGSWLESMSPRPDWRIYVALADGRVVGSGSLYVDRQRKLGWLGIGALATEYRRRGGHRALMNQRIEAARDAGCRAVVTETGEPADGEPNPSLRNMRYCGFEQLLSRANWASSAAAISGWK
jgi:GNAT superfamily N-acetyltransferase